VSELPLMDGLVRAYESHGGRLTWHDAADAADGLGIDSASVHRRLVRHFDRLERTGWGLAAALKADVLRLISDAPDAMDAYERLRPAGVAPPTFRMFRRVLIDSGAVPELRALAERDRLVWELAAIGQGPRACAQCAAERSGR
jgi:hypothetical protein